MQMYKCINDELVNILGELNDDMYKYTLYT